MKCVPQQQLQNGIERSIWHCVACSHWQWSLLIMNGSCNLSTSENTESVLTYATIPCPVCLSEMSLIHLSMCPLLDSQAPTRACSLCVCWISFAVISRRPVMWWIWHFDLHIEVQRRTNVFSFGAVENGERGLGSVFGRCHNGLVSCALLFLIRWHLQSMSVLPASSSTSHYCVFWPTRSTFVH